MKRILLPLLLISNLLFSQLVVNFLHEQHSEHTPDVKAKSEQQTVHRHGEDCKVCSMDFLFQLLPASTNTNNVVRSEAVSPTKYFASATIDRVSTIQDRAPPAI